MGLTNKTDKLDAKGLAILLRNGTLSEVWIPPGELRDQRELLRLRIFLVRLRTRVKNRIHGTLSRHNVQVPGADLFGVGSLHAASDAQSSLLTPIRAETIQTCSPFVTPNEKSCYPLRSTLFAVVTRLEPVPYRLVVITLLILSGPLAWAAVGSVAGELTDAQGKPIAGAKLRLKSGPSAKALECVSDPAGRFAFLSLVQGTYQLYVSAAQFAEAKKTFHVRDGEAATVNLQFVRLGPRNDTVTVTADVTEVDVLAPDPAMKVYASEDLLDANPGRPGAPISIPGYPIETASSGIKAPQYFAPGVAADHGEPIAQFVQVGTYLVPNNLSANAHGNGYADPNILIASVIESV